MFRHFIPSQAVACFESVRSSQSFLRRWPVGIRGLVAGVLLTQIPALVGCASDPWYDSAPPMPVPISPATHAVLGADPQVTFSWNASSQTVSYDFHIFNAANSDIDTYMIRGLVPERICSAELCSVSLTLSLPDSERHAWRVRAVNNAGASSWSRNLLTWVGQSPVRPGHARGKAAYTQEFQQ